MKNIKWIFMLYSLAAILSMVGIGAAVGLRSIPGILFAVLALCVIMGMGFKKKKEMMDAGLL
ncbi:YlaF family protein [Planomicrobium sp. CPCC 101079]|uniref:YlaF family protein n=1 Tax=Planomicrobium sp. CPCC 101079 TaxID=2599618 RepID=UPI0011B4B123|nr:YlaF family protein [Planomicrobium sp. CPCC 101079]TWT04762.1 hypothetical protein FQV28_09160 [Planomicrobium sp. CPCC 101079]